MLLLRDESGTATGPGAARGARGGSFFGLFEGNREERSMPRLSGSRVLLNTAADYRERARWAPDSLPITAKNDPIAEDFTIRHARAFQPDSPGGPFLMHYLKKVSYEPTEPLVVFAYLLDSNGRKLKPPTAIRALLTVGGEKGRVLATTEMQPAGPDREGKQQELIYSATFRLPGGLGAPKATPTNYTVVLHAQTGAGEITATNAFNVGSLGIEHTGVFADRVAADEKGTHLFVDAEFQVRTAGTFHVQGTLYAPGGEALGWAQNRVKLDAGLKRVSLRFYGKIFCDAKQNGPYTLRNFAYANVAEMPGPRSSNYVNLFRTGPHPYSLFTCEPFNDPSFLERAKELEGDAKRQ